MNRQFLVLGLGDSLLGLDVSSVREIVRCDGLTRVPGAPGELAGLILLDEKLLPVFDLYDCLKRERVDKHGGGAVVMLKGRSLESKEPNHDFSGTGIPNEDDLGILVDAIDDIIEVKTEEIFPLSKEMEIAAGEYVEGLVKHRGSLVTLLNMNLILRETLKILQSAAMCDSKENKAER